MSDQTDRNHFLSQVKAKYEAGEVLTVLLASGTSPHPLDRVYMGDMEDLGLVRKAYITDRWGNVEDIAWQLVGTQPIIVDGKTIRQGEFACTS